MRSTPTPLADDDPFEDLDALFVAFDDLCVDADGVAAAKIRNIRALAGEGERIEFVSHEKPTFEGVTC